MTRKYPIGLELGLRDGELLLPMGAGARPAAGSDSARKLTIDVSGITDFDDLPVFRFA